LLVKLCYVGSDYSIGLFDASGQLQVAHSPTSQRSEGCDVEELTGTVSLYSLGYMQLVGEASVQIACLRSSKAGSQADAGYILASVLFKPSRRVWMSKCAILLMPFTKPLHWRLKQLIGVAA
jgi:hypothetical protein